MHSDLTHHPLRLAYEQTVRQNLAASVKSLLPYSLGNPGPRFFPS
jgi:hypothetical protein